MTFMNLFKMLRPLADHTRAYGGQEQNIKKPAKCAFNRSDPASTLQRLMVKKFGLQRSKLLSCPREALIRVCLPHSLARAVTDSELSVPLGSSDWPSTLPPWLPSYHLDNGGDTRSGMLFIHTEYRTLSIW